MKEQFRKIKPYKLASHKIWSIPANEREDVLKLDWNEATIPPSPLVTEKIKELLEENVFNYYPATYNEVLLAELANYAGLPIENIQYFASSDSLHEYIAQMFINDGDKVVIVWPSYDNFRVTAEINGANIEYYRFSDDFRFDIKGFIDKIKETDPELVYMCNPNNPTGYLHTQDNIELLLKSFPDTMFLIDEAYGEFAGYSCKELVLNYENIIISKTMSKAFALANFRFGYMISSTQNVRNISTIRNAKNISSVSQKAVLAALQDVDYVMEYVKEVNSAKNDFLEAISGLAFFKVYSGYGNFVMLKFNSYENKIQVINMLEKHNIYVRNLEQDESVKNCIRITIGTRVQMKRVAEVLRQIKNSMEGV